MVRFSTYNGTDNTQRAIAHMCLQETTSKEFPSLPPEPCIRLRAEVFFPSCWDGVNLDTPNHKDHVSLSLTYHLIAHVPLMHQTRWPTPPWATTTSAFAPIPPHCYLQRLLRVLLRHLYDHRLQQIRLRHG
jgi:hypothetical protein